jgi:hypothetical protein
MDNISKSAHKISELYSNLSYFDQYGGSVVMFIVLLIILFVVVSYVTIMRNIQPIKDNWSNERCKPQVIPFAGLINKPNNMSAIDFTSKNFAYCTQNILTSITGYALQPISYMTYSIRELFQAIGESIQFIRIMLSSIRANMSNIAQEILGRIANIMVPIQQIIIAFKDAMGKVKGVLTAGLYTSLGSYYALKAMLGAIAQFIIIILIILAALVIAMWIIPFTWPVAISMTAVFISISIPLAIMIAFMTEVLHVQTSFSIPGAPARPSLSACFDKYTELKMNDGSYKTIMNVNSGDVLFGGNMITSKMMLDASGEIMYEINGTIVSSNHKILYNGKWIKISEHPRKKYVENYNEPFLYCLNTYDKRIQINGEIYMDWDELYDDDIIDILKYDDSNDLVNDKLNTHDIHSFFDSGFNEKTKIKMNDGIIKNIEDVKVGDILDKNIRVFGVVTINGDTLRQQYKYNLGENIYFEGGPNLNIDDKNLERMRIKVLEKNYDKLHHLITKERYFYVNNVKFYHYDSNVELLLDRYHENYYL